MKFLLCWRESLLLINTENTKIICIGLESFTTENFIANHACGSCYCLSHHVGKIYLAVMWHILLMSNEKHSKCPVQHGNNAVNPRNQMPELSQQPAQDQKMPLPTEREQSSIPKTDSAEKWEYPSPQQFYNALQRKGIETPENEVEMLVAIHNFLNEECWKQVLVWEDSHKRYN